MTSTLDQPTETAERRPEAVAERLLGIFNDGGIAVLASIGHQTGLFETLASLPPATSEQVADAAGSRRALRARVARRRRHRGLRRLRARRPHLHAVPRARAVPHRTRRGQPGPRDALRDPDGPGHPAGRREVPHRGRTVLRRLPRLPRRAGRGERARSTTPRSLDTIVPADGPRRPAARRHRRRRRRLRRGPRRQPAGPRLPGQPLHRLRLQRRGARRRSRRGRGVGPDQRALRDAGRRDPRLRRGVRPGHRLRRDPRPGPPGDRARQHPPGAAARRARS